MVTDLLQYRLKKQFARIDQLIEGLVIVRKHIDSVKKGQSCCREHVTRGCTACNLSFAAEEEVIKHQYLLLDKLRRVERKLARELGSASRDLAAMCGRSGCNARTYIL